MTSVTRLARPAAALARRGRLEVNALALMVSSVATGLLGVGYWIVAERYFPTEQVGQAAAVISTATMLGSLACLALGGGYTRFLPLAGHRTRTLILAGLAVTGGMAVLLGAGFVLLGPARERLFHSAFEAWLFPLLVLVLTGYALLDSILIGLRRAGTVAAKNITLSVLKIAPIPLLAFTADDMALFGSWGVLALLVSVVVLAMMLRSWLADRRDVVPQLPPTREIWAFQGASGVLAAVLTVTPLTVPLIVLSLLGPESSAYYNIVAALSTAAAMLRANVLSSFVVEASAPGAPRAALAARTIRLLALVCLVSAVGLAVAGPLLLGLVGPDYAAAATSLVLVLAVEALVSGVNAFYGALVQITRRLRLLVIVQTGGVVCTVGGALLLVPRFGLLGVGLATLGAQLAMLLAVVLPLRGQLAAVRGEPGSDSEPDAGPEPVPGGVS